MVLNVMRLRKFEAATSVLDFVIESFAKKCPTQNFNTNLAHTSWGMKQV